MSVPAVLPPAADVADDHRWQCDLFAVTAAATPVGRVSVRAAYQEALHGRATIVDLRPERSRRSQGRLPVSLGVVEVEVGVDLAALSGAARLLLLVDPVDEPAVAPAEFAAFHPDRPEVAPIHGGVEAWVASGLPIVRP